jgi:hypothetical protein
MKLDIDREPEEHDSIAISKMAMLLSVDKRILARAYDQGYLGAGDLMETKGLGVICRYGPVKRAWENLCEVGSAKVKRAKIRPPKGGYGRNKWKRLEEAVCRAAFDSDLPFPDIPPRSKSEDSKIGKKQSAGAQSEDEDEVLGLMESKQRAEMWKMRQAELDYKVAAGELVPVAETRRQAASAAQAVHNAFQPVADRYAASLAACRDEFETHRILSRAIYEALVQVDSEFKRLLRE